MRVYKQNGAVAPQAMLVVSKHSFLPILLIFILSVLLQINSSEGCSCIPPATIQSRYPTYSDIMRVKILQRIRHTTKRDGQIYVYLAAIERVYKGRAQPTDLVILTSNRSSAACGIRLPTKSRRGRRRQLVTAQYVGRPGTFSIDLCGYNQQWKRVPKSARRFLNNKG